MSGVSFKVSAETAQADARLAEINKTLLQIKGSASSLSSTLSNAFKGLAATVGITGIALTLKSASDNAILLENRMKTIAFDSASVAAAIKSVRDLSLETRTAVESTASLYQKYSKAAESLAVSSKDVLNVTKLTAQAIQLSGTAADSANAAVIQLGQGLSSGVLRGEELNSVLEQAPRLAQAIADGLGVGVGKLRALGAAGALTSEEVFNSLLSQSDKLNSEFERTTLTMANQITNIRTATSYFASEALKGISTGSISRLLSGISAAVYERADTIQAEVSGFVNTVALQFGSIKGLAVGIFDVVASLAGAAKLALPTLTQSRTLLGDLIGVASSVSFAIKEMLREPLENLKTQVRDFTIFFTSAFGLLDFDVPKAMRALFDSKSLIEFNSGLKQLARGIDSNTTGMLAKLESIPRTIKYSLQDLAGYFGLFNKPLIRAGFFEPLRDSLNEIKDGFQNNVSWISRFTGTVTPLGVAVDNLKSIFRNLLDILNAGFIASSAAIAGTIRLATYLFEFLGQAARNFSSRNTFIDVFLDSDTKLQATLKNIKWFAEDVIEAFRVIWDEVIGHSWWTDTIDTIVDTSNSLWDRSASGLNRFANNTKSIFKSIYERRPAHDLIQQGGEIIVASIKQIKLVVGEIDFLDLAVKIKLALLQVFNNVKNNYKDILETAGIGLLFMGIVSLFPGTAIAQALSAKAILAITAGLAVMSDRLISQITGGSPLGAIAMTMGEVLGRELYRFITNIPKILNAALNIVTGLFKGFVSQLPGIGPILEAFLNIPVLGNILGLMGAVLFGKSALGVLNILGIIKTTPVAIGAAISSLFSMVTRTMAGGGLVFKALFGPTEMAIVGALLLINGAFDGLLGDSMIAKVIAGGGLLLLLLTGKGAFGTLITRAILDVIKGVRGISTAFLWLSTTMTGIFTLPELTSAYTLWHTMLAAMMFSWARFKTMLTLTALTGSGFGAWFATQAILVGKGIDVMRLKLTQLTASGLGASVASKKWWFVGAAALAGGLYAGNANAEEAQPNATPAASTPENSRGFFSSVKQSISDTIDYAKSGFSFFVEKIKDYFVEVIIVAPILISALAKVGTLVGAYWASFTGIFTALGTTWVATLGGALIAFVSSPVTLIVAGLAAAGAGLLHLFGEGNTFAEKLENIAIDFERAWGRVPKEIAPASKTELLGAFKPASLKTASANEAFVNPDKFDFNGIYNENISKSIKDSYDITARAYAKTLDKFNKESLTTEGATPDTYKEVIKQGEKLAKAFDKLKTASSDIDPNKAVEKYWSSLSREKGFWERLIPAWTAGIGREGSTVNLRILQSQTGLSSSKQATDVALELTKLERKVEAATQIKDTAKPGRDLLLATDNLTNATLELGRFKKDNNYNFTAAEATKAAGRLKAAEDNISVANSNLTLATTRFVQLGLSSNFGKPEYKDSEGFTVKADYNNFAQLISTALATSDEATQKQISGMLLEMATLNKEAARLERTGKGYESFDANRKAELATSGVETFLRKTVDANAAAKGIADYQAAIKAAVKTEDLKVEIPAFLILDKNEQSEFKQNLAKFKELEDAKWSTSNDYDMLQKFRLKDMHETKMKYENEINDLRAMKGEIVALGAAAKAAGVEKAFDLTSGRMTSAGNKTLQANVNKLARLKNDYEPSVTTRAFTDPETERNFRQNLLDEIAAQQAIVDKGFKDLMTPRQAVIFDAEQLGVTLGESVIKGLATATGVSYARSILDKVLGAKKKADTVPLPQNEADRENNNKIKDAADSGFTASVADANKLLADARKLSEIFSGIGISFDSLRVFKPTDFANVINFAKELEKVSKAIEELGVNASQSTVADLLKKKFDLIKNAADVALKYAYNSVEKVAQVISSAGLKGSTLKSVTIDAAINLDLLKAKLNAAAKEEKLSIIDYNSFKKEIELLEVAQEFLKDTSNNTFGDQLERVNSQLKLSISEYSFSQLDDSFREKLNGFAVYAKTAMDAIRAGRPVEGGAKAMLKTLEDGLRSVKFISIFEGFGQKVSEAMMASADTQLSTIKSLTDFNVDPETFKSSSRSSRDELTSKTLYLDALKRMATEPSLSSNNSLMKMIEDGLAAATDSASLKILYDDAFKVASAAVPSYSTKESAAMISLPEHLFNLNKTMGELDTTVKRTQLTGRNEQRLSGEGPIGGTKSEIFERLVKAIQGVENPSGKADAVSHAGAKGSMQMMQGTFDRYKSGPNASITNADDNMFAARAFLEDLWKKYDGSIRHIVAAYHAGPGRINKDEDIPTWLNDFKDKKRGTGGKRTIDYANEVELKVLGQSSRASINALDEPSKIIERITDPVKTQILNDELKLAPNGQLEFINEGIKKLYEFINEGIKKLYEPSNFKRLELPADTPAYATGGSVWGAGTATSDSISAMLSNGEFVVKASAADKYRELLERINSGNTEGFDAGGGVELSRRSFLKVATLPAAVGANTINPNVAKVGINAASTLGQNLRYLENTLNAISELGGATKLGSSLALDFGVLGVARKGLLGVMAALGPQASVASALDFGMLFGDQVVRPIIDALLSINKGSDTTLGNELYDYMNSSKSFATGGSVWGAGTATSDSIPAMLSNGEFVVNARAAKTYRNLLDRINNGKTEKLFTGGTVGNNPSAYTANSPDSFSTNSADRIVAAIERLNKSSNTDYIKQLDSASRLTEQLALLKIPVNKIDMARMPKEDRGLLDALMSKVPAKPLDNAALYQETIDDIKAFTDRFIGSLKNFSRAAGESLRQTNQQSLASMLQASLSGKNAEEGGITIKGVMLTFAKSVTDTVANSFTQNLMGESSPIGIALSAFGKGLSDSISNVFSEMSVGGGSGGGLSGMISGGLSWLGSLFTLAEGGYVSGPGTGVSDSIPAMLSNGEFVVNAAATKEYGNLLQRINAGKLPKFATGGLVGGSVDMPMASGVTLNSVQQSSRKGSNTSVFNINVTGDISQQTRREIQQMIPQIATGVNMHNYEQGARR